MRRLGLRGKILLFAVLLVSLPLLVASLSMISITRDELKSSVNETLLATVTQLSDQLQATIDPAVQVLSLLREAVDAPGLDGDAKTAILAGAIKSLKTLGALQLTSTQGATAFVLEQRFKERLDGAGLLPETALRISSLPRSRTLADDPASIMDPLYLAAVDTWLLPISTFTPRSLSGQAVTLTAYFDVTPLQKRLERSAFASEGAVWLLSAQGRPLLSASQQSAIPELQHLLAYTQTSGAGTRLVTPFRDSRGAEMLGAIAIMRQPSWTLVVTLPSRQAYGIVNRMSSQLGLWLGLGLLMGVLGALVLAERISQPIREMAEVTQRVGAGDFYAHFRERGRCDEIGFLGRRLNQMIHGLAETHRRLDRQAHHDVLTGLPNRRFVLKYLQTLVADAEARGEGIALLFIDLDRFKTVNDSLGHAVGDQLLKMAAKRLCDQLDPGTLAARLGGDEFLVVLRGLRDSNAISAVATELIQAMSEPFQLMDYELYVGGTIGISLVPEEGAEVADLLDMSDMAMYRAKEEGRGHHQFFSADLKRRAVRKLSLDNRLRKALEREQLAVYYQPQVDLYTGRIVATEALIRWPDPNGGFVASPAEFIPLAEETGLIVALGNWVMDVVCQQVCAWRSAGLPFLAASINVSAMQFRRQDFFGRVRQALDQSGLSACQLGLELTEGVLLEDTRRAIQVMSMLKEMGIQIMIDDFGTGYSSLAYLRRFPLDYVKVAQEFVVGIGSNPHDAVIVGAVIALAKELDLKIIAEGVETSEQLDFLTEKDCDLIQGFYFGRPLEANAFEALLLGEARLLASGGTGGLPEAARHRSAPATSHE